ncbi:ATP-binding protein [Xanthobacter sp. DSM 24535]|uniref:ATP-binding response regulator n=1 Tax=Roseixanthobacter psychrophilus TaxID=3119917 RepID=UPI003727EF26
MKAPVPSLIDPMGAQKEELELICATLNCLAYSFSLNASAQPTLEWQAGTLVGATPLPILALIEGRLGASAPLVQQHLESLIAGRASQIEFNWEGADAPNLCLRDSSRPQFDSQGRVIRIVGTVRDISDEVWTARDAENEIWRSRFIEHLDQGLACWDEDDRLVLANRRFRDLHDAFRTNLRPGMSREDFILAIAHSGAFLIEGPLAAWIDQVRLDFRENRVREHQLSDGRWIEMAPIGIPEGTIVRVQDITNQKGGERALRQAKEIAETANMKKSRFLRAANHDLRQPLATLKILIYSGFSVQDENTKKDLLHSMDVTVSIMEDILGSLLQIGQLDAGRITPRVVHFQISQVMERLRIEFAPQAEAKGLSFHFVNSHTTIQSDRVLLERILSNFIANAIRFTEYGGILLGARRRGSQLDIQVWDTGAGIPSNQLELIFEEFHQVADQPSHRQKGLGLGLNIASRLAELLDHKIDVSSKPGRGSMFSVSVPIGNVWQSDLGEPEISERVGGEFLGVNVMVIEDNEMLRTTVCGLLERWGVQVTAASDGVRAIELVAQGGEVPDLVLVDYRLPNGQTGTEVLARLRELVGIRLPGIVATADTDPALIAQIREADLPVLIKPISPARLRSAMHHLLYETPHVSVEPGT